MNGRLLTRRMVPALVAALSLGLASQANALEVSSQSDQLTITDTTGDMNVVTFWRGQDEGGHQVIFVHQATGPNDLPQDYPDFMPPPPSNAPLVPDVLNHCANDA